MTNSQIISLFFLLTASLIMIYPNILAYAQNESSQATEHGQPNQATQPGQNPGGDETGQLETVTTSEGSEEKIRCSNGTLVDSSSECSSSDECPSEPSENITLQCIQRSQQVDGNASNTNTTNASSLSEVENADEDQTEDD
jgi:hypothetical protein